MPSQTITTEDLTDGCADVLTLLVKSGLVPSRSEARRAVEQGGVTVDGEKVSNIRESYDAERLAKGVVIRRGKKNYMKVELH